ncbi:MAG: hypothetical protein KAJ28_06735, partial [Flavobacteriaceae bacterium]|nr:hypothetical protein [Flavobacteriaceae bacterium]
TYFKINEGQTQPKICDQICDRSSLFMSILLQLALKIAIKTPLIRLYCNKMGIKAIPEESQYIILSRASSK